MLAGAVLRYSYYSSDSGQTWTTDRMKSRHGVYGDPCIVSDDEGKFYYFHLSDPSGRGWGSPKLLDRIVCQTSKRNGKAWNRGSGVGFNHPKDQDKEWAVFDPVNNQLIVTWTQFDEYQNPDPSFQSNIMLSRSKNGRTWSEPVQLSTTPGNCLDDSQTAEGATSGVDAEGNIYTAWSLDGKIVLTIGSVNEAGELMGFSEEITVIQSNANWDFAIPGIKRANGMPILKCDRSNGPNRGAIYINWSDQRNGENDTDIWIVKSIDQGKTWSEPARVNDDKGGHHQFFTWMDLDQSTGKLYCVFYDRRNHTDLNTDVYLAASSDGGENFQNTRISESPFIPSEFKFFGDYNGISAVNGVIRPIWTRHENDKQSIWTAIINE